MRSPLVVTSVGFHIAVVSAFLVAGFWKLERLDGERKTFDLAVASPQPPAPSGSPAAATAEPFKKKQRRIIKEVVQPKTPDPETKALVTSLPGATGDGGTGTGPGSGSGTNPTGTGTCTEEPCGEETPPKVEEKKKEDPVVVPPAVIKGLRISGETQLHPPNNVKVAMQRDGKTKAIGTFRVCVGADGQISGTSVLKSSGYEGYDRVIDDALRTWRYRPYEVGGRRVPVCGVVTFIYTMQ